MPRNGKKIKATESSSKSPKKTKTKQTTKRADSSPDAPSPAPERASIKATTTTMPTTANRVARRVEEARSQRQTAASARRKVEVDQKEDEAEPSAVTLESVSLAGDPNYEAKKGLSTIRYTDASWSAVTTQRGAVVRVPDRRFPTLYGYQRSTWNTQISVTRQGPHTLSHVVTDQLFAEAIQDGTRAALAAVFNKVVPTHPEVFDLLVGEGVSMAGTSQKPWMYKRYLMDYKATYDSVSQLIETGAIEVATLNLRAIMELHPYVTFGWKSATQSSQSSRKSLDGGGEARISHGLTGEALVTELRKNIDGRPTLFRQQDRFLQFLRSRLELGYPPGVVTEVLNKLSTSTSTSSLPTSSLPTSSPPTSSPLTSLPTSLFPTGSPLTSSLSGSSPAL